MSDSDRSHVKELLITAVAVCALGFLAYYGLSALGYELTGKTVVTLLTGAGIAIAATAALYALVATVIVVAGGVLTALAGCAAVFGAIAFLNLFSNGWQSSNN
jgi:hypothetical protein